MLLLLAVLFVAARTWSSVSLGGSIAAGLRSGIIGVLLCGLVLLIMKALSKRPLADRFGALSLPPAKAWAGLVGVVLLYLFELGAIMDQLQRAGYVAGPPIYDAIPGWGGMVAALERVGAAVTRWVPGVESYMFVSMIRGGIVFVLLPMLLLVLLGLRRGDFAAGGGDIAGASPRGGLCGGFRCRRRDSGESAAFPILLAARWHSAGVLLQRGNAAAAFRGTAEPGVGHRVLRDAVRAASRSRLRA